MSSRILIIEDEVEIAELERDYLEESGYEVELCHDGDKGCITAVTEDFDLIILDIMLPGTDGFAICRRIREYKNTPVILLSAKKDDADKIRGLGLGADDYMTKPFSPGELVARVKAHLERYKRLVGSGQPRDLIEIRGLRIDKLRKQVWVNGEEKKLPMKEFDILVLMAEHPGRVYTKKQLFELVWGMEPTGDVSTVTVHIKKIREKIELIPSDPQYVETIWGVGYRLRA